MPPKVTVVPGRKPDPIIVSANPPELAFAEDGDRIVTVGTGLFTEKGAAPFPPPGPGLVTVTTIVPVACMSALGTVTVREDGVTEVTETAFAPKVTVLDWLNPEPLIVRVNVPELTVADVGDMLFTFTCGLLTVKLAVAVPPPGLLTVTATVPAV